MEIRQLFRLFEGQTVRVSRNTHTRLSGHPWRLPFEEMPTNLNGIGEPIDGLGDIISDVRLSYQRTAPNSFQRISPETTSAYVSPPLTAYDPDPGQKLPIFQETAFPTTSWQPRSYSRRLWEKARMSPCHCFRSHGRKAWTWQDSQNLEESGSLSTLPCLSIWQTIRWQRG